MNSKMKIRARHYLTIRKGTKITTNTGKILKFIGKCGVGKNITHYVFGTENGEEIHFKMNVWPHLSAMNLAQGKRDTFGSINILTLDYLLQQLREIKKLRVVNSTIFKKAA